MEQHPHLCSAYVSGMGMRASLQPLPLCCSDPIPLFLTPQQYLELRFNKVVRICGTATFIFQMVSSETAPTSLPFPHKSCMATGPV